MGNADLFHGLPTTAISDALKSKNHMEYTIKPLNKDWKLYGNAYPVDIEAGENISVLQAIYNASPGDVLVIDGKQGTKNAFAGDFIIGLAKTKGLNGIVSNGVIRDLEGILELDFPVFCIGNTSAASKKKKIGKVNTSIVCGGVEVNPGDIVVGDVDGVVIVPEAEQEQVLRKTKERMERDKVREKEVGTDLDQVNMYLKNFLSKQQ